MVKTTLAEYLAFSDDKKFWDGEVCWEDVDVMIGGIDEQDIDDIRKLPESTPVTIEGGFVYSNVRDMGDMLSETYFKRWRKAQKTVFISVSAPKDRIDVVKAAIEEAGGKIHK